MREGLRSSKDRHGNLKTVETISENLELLDFIDELFPSDPEVAVEANSGILELLQEIEGLKSNLISDLQVEQVIQGYIEREYEKSLERLGN